MYLGLCFTSKYIFPIYSPIIPKDKSCTPLTKQTMHVMLAHPATVLPRMAEIKAHRTPKKLIAAIIIPNPVIILKGFTERLVIPSTAKETIFFNG